MTNGILYLCPTPLGNLEDITLRVLRTLREVAVIAAEDTRHTRKLLNHFNIQTRLISYHEHNERKKTPYILKYLEQGMDVALVSDAGTPGIADPGEILVQEAISRSIPVVSLPGPVAAVTALAASGLQSSPFIFYGFLPARGSKRKKALAVIEVEDKTVIFYEAPHRLVKTLTELADICADRQTVVARELTKVYEEYVRGTLTEVLNHFSINEPRGECTVLLAPHKVEQTLHISPEQLVDELIASGMDKKTAMREAANRLGLPRREVYNSLHKNKKKS